MPTGAREEEKQRDPEPLLRMAAGDGGASDPTNDSLTHVAEKTVTKRVEVPSEATWTPRAFIEAHVTTSILFWGILEIASRFIDHDKNSLSFRHILDPVVLSNMPLLILALVYRSRGWTLQAAVLAVSAGASLLYHSTVERDFLWLDRPAAILAFFSTLRLMPMLHLSPAEGFTLIASVLLAFFFYFDAGQDGRYFVSHTMWHVMIVVGQSIVASRVPISKP